MRPGSWDPAAGGAAAFSFGCGSSLEMKGTDAMHKHYLASDYEKQAKQLIANVFFDAVRNAETVTDLMETAMDEDAAALFAVLGEVQIDSATVAFFLDEVEDLDLLRKMIRTACLTEWTPEAALARGTATLYALYGEDVFGDYEDLAPEAALYLLVNENSPEDACK